MLTPEQRIERADRWRAAAIDQCVGAVWYRENGPDPHPDWFAWSEEHVTAFARRRWLRAGRLFNALLERRAALETVEPR